MCIILSFQYPKILLKKTWFLYYFHDFVLFVMFLYCFSQNLYYFNVFWWFYTQKIFALRAIKKQNDVVLFTHDLKVQGRVPTCHLYKTMYRYTRNDVMVRQNGVHVLFVKMKGELWVTVGGTVQDNHNTIKNNKKYENMWL